jgi:hypothetical protein
MASAGEVRIGLVNPRAEDDLGNAIVSRSMTYSWNPAKVEGSTYGKGRSQAIYLAPAYRARIGTPGCSLNFHLYLASRT